MTIGVYRVRRVLGRGTTGIVYEAVDPARNLPIAVKLVTQPMKDIPALLGRLQRDARAAAALGHPNIAAVLEVGEHEGQPFVAVELVPGVDLAQVIRSRKPFPFEWVLDVWRQLAEAMAHAHRSGLLHLDLKPTDVRVTPAGEVKVLDFGMAHLKRLERSNSGPAVGGVHYRAPEQVEGRRADPRADVFSAAAIVYELVARKRAFAGDDFTTVLLQITKGQPDKNALPATVFSPGFESILLKSLARDPRERYASFEALHEDLVSLVRRTAPRLREQRGEPPEKAAPSSAPVGDRPAALAAERDVLHTELTRARAEDQMQRGLDICRRLLELDPEDQAARQAASEMEAVVQDREVEQLVGLALSYAADGEVELAAKIAEKVERVAPWSPRYLQLQVYLDEEAARSTADAAAAEAREHLARGDEAAARAAAERALDLMPGHAGAVRLLAMVGESSTASAPEMDSSGEEPVPLLSEAIPIDLDSGLSDDPAFLPAPREGRPAAVETLLTAALDHFVGNEHGQARAAVDKVLALDPGNRQALELLRVLGALG